MVAPPDEKERPLKGGQDGDLDEDDLDEKAQTKARTLPPHQPHRHPRWLPGRSAQYLATLLGAYRTLGH